MNLEKKKTFTANPTAQVKLVANFIEQCLFARCDSRQIGSERKLYSNKSSCYLNFGNQKKKQFRGRGIRQG